MYIHGERARKKIKPKHWERESKACGFNPTTALRLVAEMVEAAPKSARKVLAECQAGRLNGGILKKLTTAIERRCTVLAEDYA